MYIIDEKTMDANISIEEVIDAMEQAFLIQYAGDFEQPDRLQYPHGDDVFLLMPCFSAAAFSTKLVSVYPHNRQYGLPATMATLLLNDMKSGEPLALFNGTYVTAIRTGALGGLSAKLLARDDAHSLAVVGAGTQGLFQALAVCAVRPISDIYVYDAAEAALAAYAARLNAKRPDIRVHIAGGPDQAAAAADVIVACSTAKEPLFGDDAALFAGKHIIAVGSYQPHTRELPKTALANAEGIWLDTTYAAAESGDLAIPLAEGWMKAERYQPFCNIVKQGVAAEFRQRQTVFKTVGIGLFDLIAADRIYAKVKERGLGLNIDI
ncbi:MAG: ornithine cyclodeaminase family protein [Bacillota bacterium]|nr:ornithine cyclodeaminase family protein [Bacillota bacterium]